MVSTGSRAVVFDLDGTLVDSQGDVLLAFRKGFEAVGAPVPPETDLIATIGMRLQDCFERFLGDPERSAAGAAGFRAWYETHYRDLTRPFDGMGDALESLSPHPMAVATMKKGIFARLLVQDFGWNHLLPVVVGAEEGFPSKPDPAMLLAALERLGADPARSAYVGDTAIDARTAAAAGVPFFFAAWGYGTLGPSDPVPVRTLTTPADLTGILDGGP